MATETLFDIAYDPKGVQEFDRVLSERFGNDDAPLRRWLRTKRFDEEPRAWRDYNPHIARRIPDLDEDKQKERQAGQEAKECYGMLPLPQLLTRLDEENS